LLPVQELLASLLRLRLQAVAFYAFAEEMLLLFSFLSVYLSLGHLMTLQHPGFFGCAFLYVFQMLALLLDPARS
jgi:hypothetical protein